MTKTLTHHVTHSPDGGEEYLLARFLAPGDAYAFAKAKVDDPANDIRLMTVYEGQVRRNKVLHRLGWDADGGAPASVTVGKPRPSPHLVQLVRGAVARATGRRYQIDVEGLDEASLRELARLIRDMQQETEMEKGKRRRSLPPFMG